MKSVYSPAGDLVCVLDQIKTQMSSDSMIKHRRTASVRCLHTNWVICPIKRSRLI